MGDYTKFNASISMNETGEITLVANRLLPENKNWYVQCSITISGKEFTLDTLYDFEQIDDYTYRTYGNGEYFAAFAGKQVSVLAIAYDADTGWEYGERRQADRVDGLDVRSCRNGCHPVQQYVYRKALDRI